MLALIALVFVMLLTLVADLRIEEASVIEFEVSGPVLSAEMEREIRELVEASFAEEEWAEYHADAVAEYAAEFDAIYATLNYKVAKNGRGMIRVGDSGPYKFVKKG